MWSEVFDLGYMEQGDMVYTILSGEDELGYIQLKKWKMEGSLQSEIFGKRYIILNGWSRVRRVRYTIWNTWNREIWYIIYRVEYMAWETWSGLYRVVNIELDLWSRILRIKYVE